jgi:hypothetical protein
MKTIRNEVFETNSSSMHSLVMAMPMTGKLEKFNKDSSFEFFDEEGYVIVNMGRYGWSTEDGRPLSSQSEKMSYLLTMVHDCELVDVGTVYRHMYRSNDVSPSDLLKQTDGFSALDSWIASKRENGKGISPVYRWEGFEFEEWKSATDGYKYHIDSDYYIDHQSSTDDYEDLNDFLKKNKTTLDEIILNPRVRILIDNDNH